MRPIEIITRHSDAGLIRPERFRITEDDEQTVVRVDRVLARSEEKTGKEREFIFRCQGAINGAMRQFELKYNLQTCKWHLYRM